MVSALAAAIERHSGTAMSIPRQYLVSIDTAPGHDTGLDYTPMVCFVASGAKHIRLGDSRFQVRAGEMFLGLIDAPVSATFETPYRCATLVLDEGVIASVLASFVATSDPATETGDPADPAFLTTAMDAGTCDTVRRWIDLRDEPHHINALAAHVEQELLYRVLAGPLGSALRRSMLTGPAAQVRHATGYLIRNFDQPVTVADVAGAVNMSVTSLHRHFKAVTGMSPMAFHRETRLHKARELLTVTDRSAASIATTVGYPNASAFSRDYRRRYGLPPAADRRRAQPATPSLSAPPSLR